MPAPASVDAMRATQWVPRGTDSTTRDSNEGDSNEGIGCMAAGPFQVEHCLAMEGVEAASGKGRVRVRVVQQFTPVNAAAGGRGGGREGGKGGGNEGRGAGAVAVPRLASLAVHREKWVEPFSGGAELADGAALFSSEMVEEGEGSEAVREGRVKEIEGRWEVTAREAQVPTASQSKRSVKADGDLCFGGWDAHAAPRVSSDPIYSTTQIFPRSLVSFSSSPFCPCCHCGLSESLESCA
ncbi:unnamed protein product [Closterium sp. Naga37s-1]|nr:unnamed protein product [Closterium sp. Naga37s-1]CAI5522891.1 unnamed protein product [Closterium sp. Naga37s-1]